MPTAALDPVAKIIKACQDSLVGVPDDRRDEKHVEMSALMLLEALEAAPSERSDLVAHFTKAARRAIGDASDEAAAGIMIIPLATHVLAALKAS